MIYLGCFKCSGIKLQAAVLARFDLVFFYLQEGDVVEAFSKLCEVQSDKASVEITSRYAGIIRKLHHAPGDVVQVSKLSGLIQNTVDLGRCFC